MLRLRNPFAAIPSEGSTQTETLPCCPSLDRSSRDPEIGLEPQTLRSLNHLFIASTNLQHRPSHRLTWRPLTIN
ncbi:hypothetical protein T265_00979 [Opisthorchis viverrini]|uniref:Uncharacterized protein n=1 Tax=Opisthorchis viverrini TaxID=6198 RepID=A0A075A469_OPIVI|nr:hypothetical protein T265_00979 [Opisthorchis viverrini]KER33082.1 hypothetical protein T265_00979 [Opisthorchis viverrini]